MRPFDLHNIDNQEPIGPHVAKRAVRALAGNGRGLDTLGAGVVLLAIVGVRSARPLYKAAIGAIAVGRAVFAGGSAIWSRIAESFVATTGPTFALSCAPTHTGEEPWLSRSKTS